MLRIVTESFNTDNAIDYSSCLFVEEYFFSWLSALWWPVCPGCCSLQIPKYCYKTVPYF